MEYTKGVLVNSGCSGFLCPPNHPHHNWSIQNIEKRAKKDGEFMICIESAINKQWLHPKTRLKAKELIDNWELLPIDDERTQEWIIKVMQYFRHCYSPDGINRNISDCVIIHNPDQSQNDRHLGVMFIRKYYPNWGPDGIIFKMLIK